MENHAKGIKYPNNPHFICVVQKKVVILPAKEETCMGNLITHTNPQTTSKSTSKGNPFYEFKRLTRSELDAYRVDSYGYLM